MTDIAWDEDAFAAIVELGRTNPRQAARIREAVYRHLQSGSGDVKKLEGTTSDEWRLRVGEWRVIYQRTTYGVLIGEVINRRDAYR